MIRNKSKHPLWSQILVGIIAIFLLPATQNVENRSALERNYRNEQAIQSQALFERVLQLKQTLQIPQQAQVKAVKTQKLLQNPPRFIANFSNPLAPIRAGPRFA